MTDGLSYSAQITANNPALAELKLSWATMVFTAVDGIGPMRSLHEAGDSLVAVVKMEEDGIKIIGSGVMVGPGLLLTATHVLDDFDKSSPPQFLTFLPHTARAWSPVHTTTVSGKSDFGDDREKVSDLSLVSCTLNSIAHEDYPLMLAPMEVALPLVGERLWAFGFRHQFIDDGVASVTPMVSSGIVTEAFPHGRGERMPSPCLEVEMDTIGGMSGGQVVNADGNVIGIVSSSLPGGPSYITLIWDALRYNIKGTIPALSDRKKVNLLYAKRLGLVKIKGKVERKPWGDVVFTMSEKEGDLMIQSCDPSSINYKSNELVGDQLDKFIDDWGYDLERTAARIAIDYLEALPPTLMHGFLSASGIPSECLNLIQQFSVVDFEGIEDPEILSTEKLDDSKLKIKYYFNLLTVVWIVEVSESSYFENESEFDRYFMNINISNSIVTMEIFQRCHFKATMLFDQEQEEFSEESITWSAVQLPKIRKELRNHKLE